MSAHTHQQQSEGLDESLAAQHTLAQLGFQGSVRRLLGGGARELAAADEEDDESYDDGLDIDEPLTAGQAHPSLALPKCFLQLRLRSGMKWLTHPRGDCGQNKGEIDTERWLIHMQRTLTMRTRRWVMRSPWLLQARQEWQRRSARRSSSR